MDDLLALFDETEENGDATASPAAERVRHDRPKQKRRAEDHYETPAMSQTQQFALSVDDRVGIRMLHRKVSGVDLMNLITDHPYHSPAQLSAYSLAHLNKLLADPAAIVDAATVNGKTELVTVGLVFKNSGTRLASSGNAFCLVTLGNLATGPSVSVLLFGSSYSKHCSSCTPGKVVALVNPRLIPPKTGGNDSTTITFSVSEEHQLVLVADARDYGCCKAMARAKNENGHWVSNGKQCNHYVDKRVSEYCTQHRKQANVNSALVAARGGMTTSSIQQLRLQATAYPTAQGNKMRALVGTQAPMLPTANSNRSVAGWLAQGQTPANTMQAKLAGNSLLHPRGQAPIATNQRGLFSTAPHQQVTNKKLANNSLLNPQSTTCKPTHSQTGNTLLHPSNTRQPLGTVTANPYAQRPKITPGPSMTRSLVTPSHHPLLSLKKRVVTNDILQKPKQRRIEGVSNERRLNTDIVGFNGSVAVPAPSKIFAQQKPAGLFLQSGNNAAAKHEKSADEVLAQQQLLAAQLRERKAAAEGALLQRISRGVVAKKQKRDDTSNCAASLRDTLFGSIDDIDRDRVISTQSRFAHDADAEEYARSRRVVSELELAESKKVANASKKVVAQGTNAIEKEWHCLTCKRSFQQNPFACFRLDHRVKVERNIRATQSIAEKRLALTDKKAEDGGLVLGSGLEWSRWNRFS